MRFNSPLNMITFGYAHCLMTYFEEETDDAVSKLSLS